MIHKEWSVEAEQGPVGVKSFSVLGEIHNTH